MRTHKLRAPLLPLAALFIVACNGEQTPYNEIDRFRLLAMRTADPWIGPEQTTRVEALIAFPPGADPNAEVTYAWSWCPLVGSSDQAFECVLAREELQALVDEAIGPGVITIPPYELGTAAFAEYTYSLPPALFMAACEVLTSAELPEFVTLPDCSERFPITLRLEVSSGGQTITGVKQLALVYGEGELNANPLIAAAKLFHPARPDEAIPLSEGEAPTLERDVEYRIELDVGMDQAQTYFYTPPSGGAAQMRREQLVVTWFVEGGETKFSRTTFIDGEVTLEQLRTNNWTTPKAVDFESEDAILYFVIRDGRLGTSWMKRSVKLQAAGQ